MIDINLIRNAPGDLKTALLNRGEGTEIVEEMIKADIQRRENLKENEALLAKRKTLSKEIPTETDPSVREAKVNEVKSIKTRVAILDEELRNIETRLQELGSVIPNIPDERTPLGKTEDDNVILSEQPITTLSFEAKPHWDIRVCQEQIDFEAGAKLSGSRFYVLKKDLAKLQRSLISFLLQSHLDAGYEELYVPHILRGAAVYASGQLPKFAENLYHDAEEDYWLIPTAEVPITSYHANEILDESRLTLNYCSYTPCFRREKMSAGKDVRGIKRGHQFDKVELYKFAHPDHSAAEHEKMKEHVISICETLAIPYRIKLLCTADIGFASRITYDIETWAPGCNEWLEVSSVSNCGDFQARRAGIRYKDKASGNNQFVHTLNGSAFGIPRMMISILENYQQEDGSVKVPEALVRLMGKDLIK